MSNLPSKWVICEAAWGEGRKHLYCPHDQSLAFFVSESEARKAAADAIQDGSKMVLIMEINSLLVAKAVPFDTVQ